MTARGVASSERDTAQSLARLESSSEKLLYDAPHRVVVAGPQSVKWMGARRDRNLRLANATNIGQRMLTAANAARYRLVQCAATRYAVAPPVEVGSALLGVAVRFC